MQNNADFSTDEIKSPPVAAVLAASGYPHRVFIPPGQLKSLAQAAKERSQNPNQVVRSILFRMKKDEYILVLMAGPQKVKWKSLRQYLGTSRIRMATPEELIKVTGYKLGAVGPLGLLEEVPVLIDQSVLNQDEISIGSGVGGITVILKPEILIKSLGQFEIGDFIYP